MNFMKISTVAIFIVLFFFNPIFAQKFTISGYIEDGSSGEKLIAANVIDVKSQNGVTSNLYGFYSLTLPKDSVILSISYIGFQTKIVELYLDRDIDLNIQLGSSIEMEVVEVVGERFERIENETQMSRVDIPIEQIKKMPALLGETDVLKSIQLLPGVQSGGEGQTGLYVRGGSPDQNLILLDGVPVYNVSHVLGIFSVFNADAIKNVTLTKGGFPARYGGRLSSVLEINMKEGNMQEFHGEGSIGLISSKLTLEGPIWKDKTSFIISGRRTYVDLITRPIIKAAAQQDGVQLEPRLFFYDLNAKVNHKFNDKHRLYLSAYSGADVFSSKFTEDDFSATGGIDWGNIISSLRWNYRITNKLFANTTLTYSKYDIDILSAQEDESEPGMINSFSAKYTSGIEDLGGKIDFDFIPSPNHYIRFGANATHHTYSPGALVLESTFDEIQLDTTIGSQQVQSMEYSAYIEDDMSFGNFKANLGIHASAFDVNDQTYFSIQPRLGLRYLLPNDVALKASYSQMTQFINLLTSESFSLPTDLWVPSTDRVLPQESWQVAAGVARTFLDQYEISIEGYYKQMDNVISFKEGASFLLGLDADWQDKVTQGTGESYGAEFFVQKKKGKFTGWLGYTLSWNFRQFDEINGGRTFPFRYDRRHDISLVTSYKFNDKITATLAWVYGTGNAISLPIYSYPIAYDYFRSEFDGQVFEYEYFNEIESLGDKNSFRMTDYHRLDWSIEFHKKKRKWERTWVVSCYNSYWHRNPYYIITDNEAVLDDNGNFLYNQKVFKEISILPIIPSVSYQFKF